MILMAGVWVHHKVGGSVRYVDGGISLYLEVGMLALCKVPVVAAFCVAIDVGLIVQLLMGLGAHRPFKDGDCFGLGITC